MLAVLAGADAAFTPPQVHQLAGAHSVAGVRNALVRLCAQGIVVRDRVGNAYLYRLNHDHVTAPAVIALAAAGREVVRRMRAQIAAWTQPCEFAALFGSAATGTMTATSDLDVLVVRPDRVDAEDPTWVDQLAAFTSAVAAWTGNDTRILELAAAEIGTRGTERVVADIARDGVVLAGPATYLAVRGGRAGAG